MNNKNISDIRTVIFTRDKNECYYCHTSGPDIELHLDHILPKSIFHLHGVYNLITACKNCNFNRGAQLLPDKLYNQIFKYLIQANKIFTLKTIKDYNQRLTLYYTKNPKRKKKTHQINSININQNSIEYVQEQIKNNEKILNQQKTNNLRQ